MSTDQKRVILWCLGSEIEAFDKELVKRGGPRRDHYGNPVFDVVVAHVALLRSAFSEIEKVKTA